MKKTSASPQPTTSPSLSPHPQTHQAHYIQAYPVHDQHGGLSMNQPPPPNYPQPLPIQIAPSHGVVGQTGYERNYGNGPPFMQPHPVNSPFGHFQASPAYHMIPPPSPQSSGHYYPSSYMPQQPSPQPSQQQTPPSPQSSKAYSMPIATSSAKPAITSSSPSTTSPVNSTPSSSSMQQQKALSKPPEMASAMKQLVISKPPSLHFIRGAKQKHPFTFECVEGWRVNESRTKHPHATFYNCSIKDHVIIKGPDFANCKCILKLKDQGEGKTVSETFFQLDSASNEYMVNCELVSKIIYMKGCSSSRVAYVDIYDSDNNIICVSDAFWVRSRTRVQMHLDKEKRQREKESRKTSRNSADSDTDDGASDDPEEQTVAKQADCFQAPLDSEYGRFQIEPEKASAVNPLSSLANLASGFYHPPQTHLPFQPQNSAEFPIEVDAQEPRASKPLSKKRKVEDIVSGLHQTCLSDITGHLARHTKEIASLKDMIAEQNKLIQELINKVQQKK